MLRYMLFQCSMAVAQYASLRHTDDEIENNPVLSLQGGHHDKNQFYRRCCRICILRS